MKLNILLLATTLIIVIGSTSGYAAQISSTVINGKGTVTYNGEEVWKGRVKGRLISRTRSVNGTHHAAAFAGDKIVWERKKGEKKFDALPLI